MKFMGKIIRRFQSASLVTQMMLAVLFALIIAQGLSLMILGSAYRTVLSDINQKARFQQVQSLIHLLEESPQEDYQAILSAVRSKGVWFNISKNSSVSSDVMTLADKRLVNKLTEQLGDEYKNKVLISILRLPDKRGGRPTDQENEVSKECQWGDPDCYKFFREKRDRGDHKHYAMRAPKLISLKISIKMQNGLWLNLKASAPVAPPLAAWQTIIFLFSSIFFVMAALAFMVRKITRPMGMLANASHRLGLGEQVEDIPEQGPSDLRNTIRAFNQMNNRLQRFVSDRTRMLAALSHDLRTPITTMRLRVELMPDSQDKDHLLVALDEMHQMSEATLAFMRQSSDSEPTRRVDLNAMLESLCEDQLELGHNVQFTESDEAIVSCRLISLKRAIRNLIENAVKYGDKASVTLQVSGDSAFIIIQDNGPGIPEEQRDKVFEPFFRLEESRNRDTGGIGLGMAIARNIICNHGGEIYLENMEQGLKVSVVLPMR